MLTPRITTLRLESIGDDCRARLHAYRQGKCRMTLDELTRCLSLEHKGPWVAEIVGIGPDGTLQRRYLTGMKSYRDATGVGARGVYLHYHLDQSCIYEIQEPISWRKVDRYFYRHDGERWTRPSEAEVIACLS